MELVLPTYIPLFEPPTKSQEAESLENLLLKIRLFLETNKPIKKCKKRKRSEIKKQTKKRKRSGLNKNKKNRICGIKKPKW